MTTSIDLPMAAIGRRFIDESKVVVDGTIATPAIQHLPDISLGWPPRVAIHTTSAGEPQWEFLESMLELAMSDRLHAKVVGAPRGPYMDRNRNEFTYRSLTLAADCDVMLCIDDDIKFTVDDILDLLKWMNRYNVHVAGGAYASPHDGKNFIVAYREGEPGEYVDLTVEEVDAMDRHNPTTCRVDAIGTGFLAVHRSVLELMPLMYQAPCPWFAEATYTSGDDAIGVHLGEDLTFCARLNAVGIPVYIAPHVRVTHFKKVGITLPPHPSRVSS